ncbi:hypothetical protein EZS27_028097 [termite gut metagenome]|uniref:Uncharacterized protein n=1 Tax=termite gut metagenome TaxID=433724 RepID=A0A5J4QMC9_9ZZZZ
MPRQVNFSEIESLKTDLGINSGDFIIGYVEHFFNDHKKFTDIIKAITLLKQYPNLKLLIVEMGEIKK